MTQGSNTYSKSKSGIGSLAKSKKIRTALAAAAAGYVTYKAGKAILKAGSHFLPYGGNRYYWNQEQYYGNYGRDNTMCQYRVDQNQNDFNFWINDNQRMTVMYFKCNKLNEYCCGMECCQYGGRGGYGGGGLAAIWIIIIILIVLCCCGCCIFALVYKFFRSALDICLGSTDDKAEDPGQTVTYNVNDPGAYTQDTYPQQMGGYDPTPPAYPAAPAPQGYPDAYPAAPPSYPAQPPSYAQYPKV